MYYNGTYKNEGTKVSLCGVLVRALDFKTGGLGSIPTIGKLLIFFSFFLRMQTFVSSSTLVIIKAKATTTTLFLQTKRKKKKTKKTKPLFGILSWTLLS